MIGIDTNILLRFITRDDQLQADLAKSLIVQYIGKPSSILINDVVLSELCWVLKTGYKYKTKKIAEVLHALLGAEEFTFLNPNIILEVTIMYEEKKGDFADYLISATNKQESCLCTYSFDQKAINNKIFKKIDPQN